MLVLSDVYHNRNILSLRTGQPIGYAYSPVINPDNLKIEGWHASIRGSRDPMVLPAGEIRDLITKGLVVDDHDAITNPNDLVRMKKVLELDYKLLGASVASESGTRLGKVQDYSVDNQTMYIQKLYINRSFLRGIGKSQIIIDRTQIVEVTDKKIIVKEPTVKVDSRLQAPAAA